MPAQCCDYNERNKGSFSNKEPLLILLIKLIGNLFGVHIIQSEAKTSYFDNWLNNSDNLLLSHQNEKILYKCAYN